MILTLPFSPLITLALQHVETIKIHKGSASVKREQGECENHPQNSDVSPYNHQAVKSLNKISFSIVLITFVTKETIQDLHTERKVKYLTTFMISSKNSDTLMITHFQGHQELDK